MTWRRSVLRVRLLGNLWLRVARWCVQLARIRQHRLILIVVVLRVGRWLLVTVQLPAGGPAPARTSSAASSSGVVTVAQTPGLSVVKSATPSAVTRAGDRVSYSY